MRSYSTISPAFWTGETGKAIKDKGAEAQMLALYLMSSPHSNMIGMYFLPKLYICYETGLSDEGASKGLQDLFSVDFCDYDDEAEVIWVYEMAKYQVGQSLTTTDNRVKSVRKEYSNVPKCKFLSEFFKKYSEAFHLEVDREGASKGLLTEQSRTITGTGPEPTRRTKFSEEDMTCATWVFEKIQTLQPNRKKPNFDSWANDIRLMREIDKRTHHEICKLYVWVNQDPFWRTNVLCPSKLREKWDDLQLKRGEHEKTSGARQSFQGTALERFEQRLAENMD